MLTGRIRAELSRLLPDDDTPFALAFSGGGDSLAMLQALADDKRLKGVLHVDHGLRENSTREAVYASIMASGYGHDLVTLTWEPGEVCTGLQEKARRARYGLMGDWCRAHGVDYLITAHHADDQAETVLMRVERGSGWRGAAGMRAATYAPVWPELAGITLLRPALGLSRGHLRSELRAQKPIEDPSNDDPAYTRIRLRQRLAAEPQLRADMLQLSARMARGRKEDQVRLAALLEHSELTHEGQLTLHSPPNDAQLRELLPIIGGAQGPGDLSRIRKRSAELQSGKVVALGCGAVGEMRGGSLVLMRDPVAMTGRSDGSLAPTAERTKISPKPIVWDGRFLFTGKGGIVNPERRGHHVGYRVLYNRDVVVRNLVAERLAALIAGAEAPKTAAAT